MTEYLLYGDGIHDDTDAIQSLLDSKISLVDLPAPKTFYAISRTLKIYSRQTLRLPPTAEIRLMPGSDCLMLENSDTDDGNADICLEGGVWNFDNINQEPNPLQTHKYPLAESLEPRDKYLDDYMGVAIRFFNIERLTVRNLTVKDPATFGIQMARIRYFTIENIRFDYNYGNPVAVNMDGVHIEGHCRFGHIRNLQGACYDDLLALNADDFHKGPIEDISVDGLYAADCHSAVRLLTTESPVRRITISNVRGTYYQYVIGLTYYHTSRPTTGQYDAIILRDVMASKAPRHTIYRKDGGFVYAPIYIEENLHIRHLTIENMHRLETETSIPDIDIYQNTRIDTLSVSHSTQQSEIDESFPLVLNRGSIGALYLNDVSTDGNPLLVNNGTIQRIIADPITKERL